LYLKCEATDETVLSLNRLIANNAKSLKILTLTCNGDSKSLSYELDLSPLKASKQLRILSLNCKADTTGLNCLPSSIEYLWLTTGHKQPIDLSTLPSDAWFISVNGSMVCTDNQVVYPNVTTLGIQKSDITDNLVEHIPNMFPNLTCASFGGSSQITNVSALAKNKLYMLFVDDTSIDDSNLFADFKNLQYIDISNTLIDSVQPLYKLANLSVIASAKSTKMFSDEITSFEHIKADNLPLILNTDKSTDVKLNMLSPVNYTGNYDDLKNYIVDKLGNDRNQLRFIDDYRSNKCGVSFIPSYVPNKCIKLNTRTAYSVAIGSTEVLSDRVSYKNISDFHNVKRVTLTYDIKSFYTLPKDARLEYFSANLNSSDLDIVRKNKVVLSELETLCISSRCDDEVALSELDFLMSDTIKNVSVNEYKIKSGGSFRDMASIENISISSINRTEINFNLDAMPNLKSITLKNVIPHFKVSHKHDNLKCIQVSIAGLSSVDDMFDVVESVSTPLITPTQLELNTNHLESLESNVIDLSTVEILNLNDNLLTDETVTLGNFNSLQMINAGNNLLSNNKLYEISNFNKKDV
jgi:hypothetical protein